MDTLTHFLSGNILYMFFKNNSYPKQDNQKLYALSIISSVLPDFDLIYKLFGSIQYYKNHRGITHSIILISILLICSYFFCKKKTGIKLNKYFLIISINLMFHLFLDLTNSYGTMIFSPFSNYRVSWDIFFIMDFIIILLFSSALLINRILKKYALHKYIASVSIFIFSAYFLYSLFYGKYIAKKVEYILNGTGQKITSVLPGKLWAFNKTVILEDDSHFYAAEYLPDRFIATQFPKFSLSIIENDFIFQKIINTNILKFYLDFSRFPAYKLTYNSDNIELLIYDLRFYDEHLNPDNSMFGLNFRYIKKTDTLTFKFNKLTGII